MSLLSQKRSLCCLILLLLCISAVFVYSVVIRKPWFGQLVQEDTGLEFLTGLTAKVAREWHRYGPLSEGFGLIYYPRSVATPTLSDRTPITTYGGGLVVPVYLLGFLPGITISPGLVMAYNLLSQWGVAALLGVMLWRLLRRGGFTCASAFCFSLAPPLFYLLLPFPLYFHQNVYWADMAVLLPYIAVVALELEGYYGRRSRGLKFHSLMALLLFWGACTEWLFFPLVFCLWLARITERAKGKAFLRHAFTQAFWLGAPCLLAGAVFFFQLFAYGNYEYFLMRFLDRSRMAEKSYTASKGLFNSFLATYMTKGLGVAAPVMLFLSLGAAPALAFFQARNQRDRLAPLLAIAIFLLVTPPVLHTILLREHASTHAFSVLKFAPGIAVAVFVALPVLLQREALDHIIGRGALRRVLTLLLAAGSLSLCCGYLLCYHDAYQEVFTKRAITSDANYSFVFSNTGYARTFQQFKKGPGTNSAIFKMQERDSEIDYPVLGGFIDAHTGVQDILFSQELSTPLIPGQLIGYSLQRIYPLASILDIYARCHKIDADYRINVLSQNQDLAYGYGLPAVLEASEVIEGPNQWRLYRLSKEVFLEHCAALAQSDPKYWKESSAYCVPVYSYEDWLRISLPGWAEHSD